MSGHSKWNNIKRRKGAVDAERGKIFTKFGREIQVAVKEGGPDPDTNARLKDIISKAKSNNMPNENIQRSIKKASGEGGEKNYEAITYEGYGPEGVAIIVKVLTDNRNRTAGEIRHAFDRSGGNLGTSGCVSYMFTDKGILSVSKEAYPDEDELTMDALEAGAEDIDSSDDEEYIISTLPENFREIRDALSEKYSFIDSGIESVPNVLTSISESKEEQVERLLENLEDNDDVQEVFSNWDKVN